MIEFKNNLVVTGASSDIGRELLRGARDRGVNVLGISRSEMPELNGVTLLSGQDLTQRSSLEYVAEHVRAWAQGQFCVVHAVGSFWRHKPLIETPFQEIADMLDSHVLTLLGVKRYLTPILMERQGGRFVSFSCNSVYYNYPDMLPFTASKAAIESIVRSYAHEYSQFGISSFALALPTILTDKVRIEKVNGDHPNYVTTEELVDFILDDMLALPHIASGNVIKVFKHSPTFYHSSYYDRNPPEVTTHEI